MRIRKNASLMKLSGPPPAAAETILPPQTTTAHVTCQLNQSPWDVISSSSYLLLNRQQLEAAGDDSWNDIAPGMNGSLDEYSVAGVESAASMMEVDESAEGELKAAEENEGSTGNADASNYHAASSRGTTRRGGRGVSSGTTSYGKTAASNTTSSGRRGRGRGKAAKKGAAASAGSTSSDPYGYYYYSGFGPLWGKRRGGGGGGDIREAAGGGTGPATGSSRANSSSPPLAAVDFIDQDYDFDDDDDEEELGVAAGRENGGDFNKKRTRKPVKARSLKSLM